MTETYWQTELEKATAMAERARAIIAAIEERGGKHTKRWRDAMEDLDFWASKKAYLSAQ